MTNFEYQTEKSNMFDPEKIEAHDFELDTVGKKLTFTDGEGDKIASFAIGAGAWVKRVK